MVNDSDVKNSNDDDSPQGTAKLVERLTERADLAERMREAAWFQDHADALFLAGALAVIPRALAGVRRAVRARRRRPRG